MLTVIDVNGNASSCTAIVTVEDNLAPIINCPSNQIVAPNSGLNYIVPDYFGNGEAFADDNCTNPIINTSQDPAIGTILSNGIYTVTLSATDDSGNESICDFELEVDESLGIHSYDIENTFSLYPNPSNDIVNIGNPLSITIENIFIYDLTGRLVQKNQLSESNTLYELNVSILASANYLIVIQTEDQQFIKQMIKR